MAKATSAPLKAPIAAPASMPSPIAPAQVRRPSSCANNAATTPDSPTTLPTDRSMPPVRMTKVAPVASSALAATWIRMTLRLDTVRKERLDSASVTRNSARMMTSE